MATVKNKTIELDIGGTVFKTELFTLMTIPGSRLANIEEETDFYNQQTNIYYFDRDPHSFKQILNAYRNGELHVSRDICPQQFRQELKFWRVPIKMLSPCCWKAFYKTDDDLNVIGNLLQRIGHGVYGMLSADLQSDSSNGDGVEKPVAKDGDIKGDPKIRRICSLVQHKAEDHFKHQQPKSAKARLWLLLEEPRSSLAAKVWCYLYLAVVVLNVSIILTWAEPGARVNPYLTGAERGTGQEMSYNFSGHLQNLTFTDPHVAVFVIDLLCMFFFIAEATLHFYVCPNKRQYPKDFYNIVKVFLCLTMVLTLVLDLNKLNLNGESVKTFTLVIRSFSVLRLILIFRLHKLYQGLDILLLSMKHSFKELFLLIFAISVLVVIYGTIMFSAEIGTNVFPNVWISMWWSIITMTTVGYGDFHPTSSFGYIVGTLCAVNGLLVLAMPVAAVAGKFSVLYARHNDILKHQAAMTSQQQQQQQQSKNNNVQETPANGKDKYELKNLENTGEKLQASEATDETQN